MSQQHNEKTLEILAFLEEGQSREEIADYYGNANWKSVDMYMRRKGFSWDSENQTYVEKLKSDTPSATEESIQVHTKAAQIVRMLDVKHPDPRSVANKQGFETVDEMGIYMKSQGYKWCNDEMNYQYDEDVHEKNSAALTSTPSVDGLTVEHLALLDLLVKHQEHFFEWIAYQEGGQVPYYKFRGTPTQKTLTMTSSSVALLNDFSDEFSIPQKVIVEAALVEYFRKYGYGEQVKKVTT